MREVADKCGLTVLKRVTTGSDKRHFATFELSGTADGIRLAWQDVYGESTSEQRRGGFVYRRNSDADGSLYIGVESVWCDEGDRSGAEVEAWQNCYAKPDYDGDHDHSMDH